MGEGCYNYGGGMGAIDNAYNQYVSNLPWAAGGLLPSPDPLPGWDSDAPNCGFWYGTVCLPYPLLPAVGAPSQWQQSLSCTLSVESRPLNYPGFENPPDLHGYLDFTYSNTGTLIFEGRHNGSLLGAAGEPTGPGDNPASDTNDGHVSGPAVCLALGPLETDVSLINKADIAYDGPLGISLGPNSSSALRYMLQSVSFLQALYGFWYRIPLSMQLTGYCHYLPGLEPPN